MASHSVENSAVQAGDKLSACEVISASERASDFKKDFICSNDMLHEQMLNSPWPVLMYAFSVLFIMFLVKRAADVPHRAAARAEARAKASADNADQDRHQS